MNLQQFIKETFDSEKEFFNRPRIYCKDGFNMSVQGSKRHYCSPRSNQDYYNSMEIGYPSQEEKSILEFAEQKERPTDTFYGWVPCELIQNIIDNHGGIDINKTFNKI